MRKIYMILVLAGTLFLAGCDKDVPVVEETGPSIEVIGEQMMYVTKGTTYTEQGATIIGADDAVLTTSGEVDTSTFGVYYIDYSFLYEGETIRNSRRVSVVTATENDFNILVGYVSKTTTSLSFAVSVDDDDGLLNDSLAILYKNNVVVEEKYYGDGNTLLTFEDLQPNTYYQIKLTGTFTDNDVLYSLTEYGLGVTTLENGASEELEVKLNGEQFMTIDKNASFVDPGAYVEGHDDMEVTVISNLDKTTVGNYHVIYTIEKDGKAYNAYRQITVVELNSQISVVLNGDAVLNVLSNKTFTDPGAYIVGYSGNVAVLLKAESTVNVYIPGQYEIVYSVIIDSVTYSATRTVNVQAAMTITGLFLRGEQTMTINQGSQFVDPGAFYAGDESVVVTVEHDIDTTVVGEYTVVYSAVVGEITRTVSRTVNVVAVAIPDFKVSLSELESTSSSLSFLVMIDDSDNILVTKNAELYQGDTLISTQAMHNGMGTYQFTDLDPETTYRIKLVGQYNNHLNVLVSFGDYSTTATTASATALDITMDSHVVGISTLDSVISVVDTNSKLDYMYLRIYDVEQDYLSTEAVLAVGTNSYKIEFLQPNTQYKAVVEYGYYNEENTYVIDVIEDQFTFTTDIVPSPTVSTYECDADNDEVKCAFTFDETGFDSDTTYFIRLEFPVFWANQVAYLDEDGEAEFEYGVLSNTDYIIAVYATATITETGERYTSRIAEYNVPTADLLAAPTIENLVQLIEPNKITLEFDLVDTENSFEGAYVKVGNTRIDIQLGHNVVVFDTNINADDDYYIGYYCNYDNGDVWDYEQYKVIESATVMTPPEITLESFAGDGMFFNGDLVVLAIDLDNNDDYDIDSVTINGVVKDTFKFPVNNEMIYVTMDPETTGDHVYILDSVNITVNDVTYSYEYNQSLAIHVYDIGEVDPDYATVTPVKYTTHPTDDNVFFVVPEDDEEEAFIDLYIHLDNEYNLLVTGLGLTRADLGDAVTDFDILSPNVIRVSTQVSKGENKRGLYYIDYEVNGVTVRKDLMNESELVSFTSFYGYKASEAHAVSTAAEFLAMGTGNGDSYYYLTNDIDFAGEDIPSIGTSDDTYYGYFNGNGHTLSNFNIVKNTSETSTSKDYIGLFGKAGGFIGDLKIYDAHIDVTLGEFDNTPYVGIIAGEFTGNMVNVQILGSTINVDGYAQGIIGGAIGSYQNGWYDIIENSSADVDITVTADLLATVDDYDLYVGGLLGVNDDNEIHSSYSDGNITITNTLFQTVYTGGLIGKMVNGGGDYSKPAYIFNSYSGVDIITSGRYTGGLLGGTNELGAKAVWLENVFAFGDIISTHPSGRTGGLVGYLNGTVHNSFSTSSLDVVSGYNGYLVSSYNSLVEYSFSNSYYYDGVTYLSGGNVSQGSERWWAMERAFVASNEQFNSKEFYTDILGYSPLMFDFDTLNVGAELLPTIK